MVDTLRNCNEVAFLNIFTTLKILALVPVTTCECKRFAVLSVAVGRDLELFAMIPATFWNIIYPELFFKDLLSHLPPLEGPLS